MNIHCTVQKRYESLHLFLLPRVQISYSAYFITKCLPEAYSPTNTNHSSHTKSWRSFCCKQVLKGFAKCLFIILYSCMLFNCALLNSTVLLVNVVFVCDAGWKDALNNMVLNWIWQYICYLQINPASFFFILKLNHQGFLGMWCEASARHSTSISLDE